MKAENRDHCIHRALPCVDAVRLSAFMSFYVIYFASLNGEWRVENGE
jgi:hypothetical protein